MPKALYKEIEISTQPEIFVPLPLPEMSLHIVYNRIHIKYLEVVQKVRNSSRLLSTPPAIKNLHENSEPNQLSKVQAEFQPLAYSSQDPCSAALSILNHLSDAPKWAEEAGLKRHFPSCSGILYNTRPG